MKKRRDLMESKEKVLLFLKEASDPQKAGEIAEALGIEKKDVDKAIKELKKAERIDSPKRCYYRAK
jgi:biotin operon repressor